MSLNLVLECAELSILPNGNFWEFFLWRGEFCVFEKGIPGGPADNLHKLQIICTELLTNSNQIKLYVQTLVQHIRDTVQFCIEIQHSSSSSYITCCLYHWNVAHHYHISIMESPSHITQYCKMQFK